jgi:hypothetical protein
MDFLNILFLHKVFSEWTSPLISTPMFQRKKNFFWLSVKAYFVCLPFNHFLGTFQESIPDPHTHMQQHTFPQFWPIVWLISGRP